MPLVHLWTHGVHHTYVLWVHRWQGGFFNTGAHLSWNSRYSRATDRKRIKGLHDHDWSTVYAEIFANFAICFHWQNFYHTNFLSCVTDYMRIWRPLLVGENLFHRIILQYKGSWAWWNFCPVKEVRYLNNEGYIRQLFLILTKTNIYPQIFDEDMATYITLVKIYFCNAKIAWQSFCVHPNLGSAQKISLVQTRCSKQTHRMLIKIACLKAIATWFTRCEQC